MLVLLLVLLQFSQQTTYLRAVVHQASGNEKLPVRENLLVLDNTVVKPCFNPSTLALEIVIVLVFVTAVL